MAGTKEQKSNNTNNYISFNDESLFSNKFYKKRYAVDYLNKYYIYPYTKYYLNTYFDGNNPIEGMGSFLFQHNTPSFPYEPWVRFESPTREYLEYAYYPGGAGDINTAEFPWFIKPGTWPTLKNNLLSGLGADVGGHTFKIQRSASSLKITRNDTGAVKTFSKTDFGDNVIPTHFIFLLQGGGGGGGSSLSAIAGVGGGGGAAGGFTAVTVDMSVYGTWILEVGKGGAGATLMNSHGVSGMATKITCQDNGVFYAIANGGAGGCAGSDTHLSAGGTIEIGNGSYAYKYIYKIVSVTGAQGGSRAIHDNGYGTKDFTVASAHEPYITSWYEYYNMRTFSAKSGGIGNDGGGTAGGGGASPYANGGRSYAASKGGIGSKGSGGAGGSYVFLSFSAGGNGGDGLIAMYY